MERPERSSELTELYGSWSAGASKEGDRGTVRPREGRAQALGWLSIGLGVAQLVAPRQIASLIGADGSSERARLVLRAIGARELVCGLGLLSRTNVSAWAWARVAGDVIDVALLGSRLGSERSDRDRVLGTTAAVLAATALDVKTALELGRASPSALELDGIAVTQAITINRPSSEVYAFFRNLENLPRFMAHLESVRVTNGHSHWTARGPLGSPVEWDAEVIEDRPGKLIAWRSVAGSDVPNQGSVRFRLGPDGSTELIVELRYDPPAGAIGAAVARLFGAEPAQAISADLRRLKQVLETGEVTHSDASIHRGMHPARPARLQAKERGLSA